MDKNKLELTCIYKDGSERNILVNLFNVKWVCDKILGRSSNGCRYIFSDKLSFIHLKNFSFSVNCSFDFDCDTVVVFENCYFEGDCFYFKGGQVQIINSGFNSKRRIDLNITKCSDFEFCLDEGYSLDEGSKIEFNVIDCGKFSVSGQDDYYSFNVYCDECYFDKIKNFSKFFINSKKLVISKSNIFFGARNINGKFVFFDGYIDVNNLIMNDVLIKDYSNNFKIRVDNLVGNNYEVSYKGLININGKRYFNETNNDTIIILSDNKMINGQMDLISVFKGYKEYLEDIIDEEVWRDVSVYNRILTSQEKIIEVEEKKLWALKKEIDNKALERRKKLYRSKIREIASKN